MNGPIVPSLELFFRHSSIKMNFTEQQINSAKELVEDLQKIMSVTEMIGLADRIFTLKVIGEEMEPHYISTCVANVIYERIENRTL